MTMRNFSQALRAICLVAITAAGSSQPAISQTSPPAPTLSSPIDPMRRQTAPNDVRITANKKITLRQALELANQNNREIQSAVLQTNRSVAAIREAQAAESLTVAVDGSLSKFGAPVISNIPRTGTSTPLSGGIEANYPLSSAGRNSSLVKAAQEQLTFDQLDVDRIARQVRSGVITAYYDLQDADAQLEINLAAVKNAEESLRNARIQERAGLGTKFDVIRAEVQKATAEQDVVSTRSQQKSAQKSIAQLLNLSEITEYSAADPIATRGDWLLALENSIVEAYKNRPELKQQEIRRNISEQQAKAAAAGDRPQFSLFARYDLAKDFEISQGFADNYSLGARVSWSLFDGGATSSRVTQQQINQSIADTNYIVSRDQVRLQVEQTYFSLKSNQLNIGTAKQAQDQATESLRLARLRLAAGVGTQTDVINAETELTRARSNYSRAIINYNRALSTLRNNVYINQF